MLGDTDRRNAREFQRRLAALIAILDRRLFGARARGDAAPDSDMAVVPRVRVRKGDVFIEPEDVAPELRQGICEIAWEVGVEMDRVICTVVATRDDLEQRAMGSNPLVLDVEREGVRP